MKDNSRYVDIPYVEGKHDCYGLLRNYYREEYGIVLTNYARPGDFAYSGLDLIYQYFKDEGFKTVDISLNLLERGDVLLIRIGNQCPTVNHIGVSTGAGYFLHHVVDSPSREEVLSPNWKRRVMTVVRHPDVAEKNLSDAGEPISLIEFLPPHVRHHIEQQIAPTLGPDSGEVRSDPPKRRNRRTAQQV